MTQLQLQNLIINSLGPIIDQSIRKNQCPMSLAAYNSLKAQLAAATITQAQFNALWAKEFASLTHEQRLAFYIAIARQNGDLPAASTTAQTSEWPDSNWTAIVNA
jgi:hypothetical protein